MKRIIITLFFFLFVTVAQAQWAIIPTPKFESLRSSGSVAWGWSRFSMYVTEDYGASWRRCDPQPLSSPSRYLIELTLLGGGSAHSIYIYDGVVHFAATYDAGRNWRDMPLDGTSFPDALGVSILGPHTYLWYGSGGFCYISGLAQQQRKFHRTTDYGVTWTSKDIADVPEFYSVLSAPNGDMFGITNDGTTTITKTYKSTDNGASWALQSTIDKVVEPWSFVMDSCSRTMSFYSNDRFIQIGVDTFEICDVYVSPDEGVHWESRFTYQFKENHGSTIHLDSVADCLAVSPNALYAAHVNGVFRTTNHGKTWQNIGGPFVLDEAQGLTALSDNILLAMDGAGNVWYTANAGGFPLSTTPTPLTFAPDTLFLGAAYSMCDTLSHTELFTIEGGAACYQPLIVSQRIIGADAANYAIIDSLPPDWIGPDTAKLEFHPAAASTNDAAYEIKLSDGRTITIPLVGVVNRGEDAVIHIGTANIRQDTIGGDVRIPIIIKRSGNISSIGLSASFDSTLLDLTGAFDINGKRIDTLTDFTTGRVFLHLDSVSLSVTSDTIGYLTFRNFIGNAGCTDVVINSLAFSVDSAVTICRSDISPSDTATICSDASCGRDILAEYLRRNQFPKFTISPNPASGNITLTSSHTLGMTNVEVYDVMGQRRISMTLEVLKTHPTIIDITMLPTGVYYVRVDGYEAGIVVTL